MRPVGILLFWSEMLITRLVWKIYKTNITRSAIHKSSKQCSGIERTYICILKGKETQDQMRVYF